MTTRLHDDEIAIDDALVRALLSTLDASWDNLPLRRLDASGSSNALFRLGDDLLVRLPRQPGGTATIEKEQRWTPYVAAALPVAVPEIVAVGDPGFGYPERWSVVRWLDGTLPALPRHGEPPRHDLARALADLVIALRDLAVPDDAARDPALEWYRGRSLATMDDDVRTLIGQCREVAGLDLDLDACSALWEETLAGPGGHDVLDGAAPRWYHGDLVAENLLVRDGRLHALLDLGGLSVGDPTIDLHVAWELLDPVARTTFREAVDVDEPTWLRARGWALALSVMTFPYYWTTMPERCAQRLAMARAVLADSAG